MKIIPWRKKNGSDEGLMSPSDRLSEFRTQMDHTIDSFLSRYGDPTATWMRSMGEWSPTIDVRETDTHIKVRAEIPGVSPDDVQVTITGRTLTLSGTKEESREGQDGNRAYTENYYGSFKRHISLPTEVDRDHVTAEGANGVLTIELAKLQASKPRRIPVMSR